MNDFVNPSNSQSDLYVDSGLREDISRASSSYEELKFRPDRVKDILQEADPNQYVSNPEFESFSEYDTSLADDIDSFTAPEIVETLISDSEITDIATDHEQGLFGVDTYKTAGMDDTWMFWTPYVDDSSGEVVGIAKNPYTQEESAFSYSVGDPLDVSICSNRDIGDAVYMLARETIPEGPEVSRATQSGRKVDQNFLTGQFSVLENELGLISELEEAGEIKTGDYSRATGEGPRGGHLAGAVRDFVSLAREARIIDYTVSSDNRENRVRIRDGGYKHLTRDLSKIGFNSTDQLIHSRTPAIWKSE